MRPWIKSVETFRDDFTYSNSPEAFARFPFPFPDDEYMYSVNLELATPGAPGSVYEHWFDVDEHYLSEVEERHIVLEEDPGRCRVLPHMRTAEWDTLEMIMTRFAQDYPHLFTLQCHGDRWIWENKALNLNDSFTFGDDSTLPCGPFEYITRQAQGDFNILDQRNGDLFMDGGMITGPADWSLTFDLGMSFKQWHGPVPLAHEIGVFDRALKYLLNVQVDRPVRRLNWTITVNPRMDTSSETYNRWGSDRAMITAENAGDLAHLRVELQFIARLPRSHGILFSIRTYLISLRDLSTNTAWLQRMRSVIKTLPPAIAEYKGMKRTRAPILEWLETVGTKTTSYIGQTR